MNIKTIFIVLFLASFCSIIAQNNPRVNQYCENVKASFDVILVEEKKVQYQIIDIAQMDKWKGELAIDCILPDYSSKFNKLEIKKIAVELKNLNPKYSMFTFYKSCDVYLIFISSTYPTEENQKKLKEGYIGEVEIID